MEYLIFLIKSSIDDFAHNKLRTFLTSLGLLIGVASVVLLVAMGLGLKAFIAGQFQSLGTQLVFVMPGNFVTNGQFTASGPPAGGTFDQTDATNLKRIRNVSAVLPFFVKTVKMEAQGNSYISQLDASTQDIFTGLNLEIEAGRPFTRADYEKGAKVVVIGPEVASKLFQTSQSAIGKTVKISTLTYRVIGVTKTKGGGGLGGGGFDGRTFMPQTAALPFNPTKKFFTIYLKSSSNEAINQIKADATRILLKRYKSDDFSVVEQAEFLSAINSIFSILNGVLVAIAAISLVVGGIGIMNIMYVSVAERTHEIGIRRAVGATQKDVLLQFITEAVILSILGGVMGLLLSGGIVLAIRPLFPAYIDPASVFVAIGVSSAIGLIFGVLPARHASQLSPIEAIRYE